MLVCPTNIICGFTDCSGYGNLTESPKREVKLFEIEYYLDDAISMTVDGVVNSIYKDHILIAVPKNIRNSRLPFTTLFLKFEVQGELADMLYKNAGYFGAKHAKEIKSLLSEIIALKQSGQGEGLLFQSKILAVLNLVLRDAETKGEKKSINYRTVKDAKRYIEDHFAEPITLSDISASVNLSGSYLHTVFTETTGRTPHDYLIECRLAAAEKQLWDTRVGISDIAEKCGFGCQQYMNKIFKNRIGMTQGQYRKSFQQNYLL